MPKILIGWVDLRVTKMWMATGLAGERFRARGIPRRLTSHAAQGITRPRVTARSLRITSQAWSGWRGNLDARKLVPAPLTWKNGASKAGFLAYGSSDYAIREGMDLIKKEYGQDVDYMRIRAYPFAQEIHDYIASHERIYVVEQDRDAQLASLLKLDIPAEQTVKLRNILHFSGLPLDAQTVVEEFAAQEGLSSIAAPHLEDVEEHEGAVAS